MSQVQQVKEATDIIQVLGERLQLQRSGTNWRGLCPFHGEKSPSFFINEQFQRYRCFGCGEHGDVFTFLEKYEGMTFGEALKYLAERAGIELTSYAPTPAEDQKERLLAILNLAKEYYHYLLTQHQAGEPGRAYLKQRHTTQESVKVFQLGYALPSWDGLVTYLIKKKKLVQADVVASGLAIEGKGGRIYDRFRGRLMFPLTNHRGQVVGFSGRYIASPGENPDPKEAKYINTPETQLYHKSQMLFGYSELFQEIRKKGEVIVVEGEFDVISSAQAHVNHIVAIKGSAMTQEHVKLLKRVVDRVVLALDADSAGVEATKRAIAVAGDAGLELRVLTVPSGKDPDELARQDPAAWREVSKTSISVYEFLIQAAIKKHDPATPEGKRHIMTELAPVLNSISLVVEQDFYLKKLAEILATNVELIRKDVQNLKLRAGANKNAKNRDQNQTSEKPAQTTAQSAAPDNKQTRLEAYILFLLFHTPADQVVQRRQEVSPANFSLSQHRYLLEALQKHPKTFELKTFAAGLAEDYQQTLFDIYLNPTYQAGLEKIDLDKEWKQSLKDLVDQSTKAKIAEITRQLDELDAKHTKTPEDEELQNELLLRVVALRRKK